MSDEREHVPDCWLFTTTWLRNAIRSAQMLADATSKDVDVDRVSATALLEALAHDAEGTNPAAVSLLDVVRRATADPAVFPCSCPARWTSRDW
jgi:hypothetical protein